MNIPPVGNSTIAELYTYPLSNESKDWPQDITWEESKVKKLASSDGKRRADELAELKAVQDPQGRKTIKGFLIEQFEAIKKAQEAQEVGKFEWIRREPVSKRDGVPIQPARIAMFGSFTLNQTKIIILTNETGKIQNFGIPGHTVIPPNCPIDSAEEYVITKMIDEYKRM